MVDFARILQKQKDQKMMAEIIVDEILSEIGGEISWWDDEDEKKFREKYIAKICRMP